MFYLHLFVGGLTSYLRYFVCLRIVMFNTYCVVFLLCFSSSCCQFLWIVRCLIAPSVFSNVYELIKESENHFMLKGSKLR